MSELRGRIVKNFDNYMGKQAVNKDWFTEKALHEILMGLQKFCASFARSTAHVIVKIQSESSHVIRKFTDITCGYYHVHLLSTSLQDASDVNHRAGPMVKQPVVRSTLHFSPDVSSSSDAFVQARS